MADPTKTNILLVTIIALMTIVNLTFGGFSVWYAQRVAIVEKAIIVNNRIENIEKEMKKVVEILEQHRLEHRRNAANSQQNPNQ